MATNKGRLPVNAEHLKPRSRITEDGRLVVAGNVLVRCAVCGVNPAAAQISATADNARLLCAEDSLSTCSLCRGRWEIACLIDAQNIMPETVHLHSLYASVEGELARADEAKAEREARRRGASLEGLACECGAPAPANANPVYWYCSVCHSANSQHADGDRAVSTEQPFGSERERAIGLAIDRPARKVSAKVPRVTVPNDDDGIPF
jgi:hypothetical protein